MSKAFQRIVFFVVVLLPRACFAATSEIGLGKYETTSTESLNGVAVYAAAGFFLMALAQMQQLQRMEIRRRKIEEALARLLASD